MTERCIELVKRFEGFVPHIYICPAGYPTIGYGHVVLEHEIERFKDGITEEEAEELLKQDLLRRERRILPWIKVVIHPWMLDAILSFVFNIGCWAFYSSTLRRKLNRGEFLGAADEFPRWVYSRGRKLRGLVRRRAAERELFLEGVERLWVMRWI